MTEAFQFQQDMLASLIRFLREKIAQQRDALLRVKQEREELKSLRKCAYPMLRLDSWLTWAGRIAEELRAENEQLRLYAGLNGNGSNTATSFSGKRRRTDAYR
jgi:hypothetical protein